MESRTLVTLIDEDNYISNPVYRFLFLDLIEKFGDFIWAYAREAELNEKDRQLIDLKFNEITTYLNEIVVYNHDTDTVQIQKFSEEEYERLFQAVLKRGGYSSTNREEQETFAIGSISTFQNFLKKIGKESFLTTVLFASSKPFFYQVSSMCQKDNIKKLVLMSGSLHLVGESSQVSFNIYKMQSIFYELLKSHGIKGQLDEFLAKKENCADVFSDPTKFSLLYAVVNRVSLQNKNQKVSIIFREDSDSINEALKVLFTMHSDLIPKNIKLVFWPCDGFFTRSQLKGENLPVEPVTIEGTGNIADNNYSINIKKIGKLFNSELLNHEKIKEAVEELLAGDALTRFKEERKIERETVYSKMRGNGLGTFHSRRRHHRHSHEQEGEVEKRRGRCVIL